MKINYLGILCTMYENSNYRYILQHNEAMSTIINFSNTIKVGILYKKELFYNSDHEVTINNTGCLI